MKTLKPRHFLAVLLGALILCLKADVPRWAGNPMFPSAWLHLAPEGGDEVTGWRGDGFRQDPFENSSFKEGRASFALAEYDAPDSAGGHYFTLYSPSAHDYELDPDWVGSARSLLYYATGPQHHTRFSITHGMFAHSYRRAGYFSNFGPRAARDFEHWVRLGVEAPVSARFAISVPLYLQQVHHGNFRDDARYNDRWRYAVWLSPQVSYQMSEAASLALGYETDTFVGSDLQRFYFWDSLAEGEVSLRLSLKF